MEIKIVNLNPNSMMTGYERRLAQRPNRHEGRMHSPASSEKQKNVPAILSSRGPAPRNLLTSYYFNDGEGNVTALVSPSGMILPQYEYDPSGNLISMSGPLRNFNKYRFSSKEWDANAGLYYYLYRFYDPGLQRWLGRDPIDGNGFDAVSHPAFPFRFFPFYGEWNNRYRFDYGDPGNSIDPLGLIIFTRPCNVAEIYGCMWDCGPLGVKSCTVQEDMEYVPGKPPKPKAPPIKHCVCNPPPKGGCYILAGF